MIANLVNQLPILQVIWPFAAAILSVFIRNLKISNIFIAITSLFSLFISIILLSKASHMDIVYSIGDWIGNIGIEYKISKNVALLNCAVNLIFVLFSLFLLPLIEKNLSPHRFGNLFYSLLLIFYTGTIGIIVTNDIFNLYVFLEIMSLSSYAIVSYGQNKKALIAAFDYLIIGSLSATFILVSIGILLYVTGSLNITDIKYIIANNAVDHKLLKLAAAFMLIGTLTKIGLAPFNFWMVKAYYVTNPISLTFLSSISSIANFCILIKFTDVLGPSLATKANYVIYLLSIFSILFFALNACYTRTFRSIVIYSSLVSVGYSLLIYSTGIDYWLLIRYLIADAIGKFALFTIIVQLEHSGFSQLSSLKHGNYTTSFKFLTFLTLIHNAALPITIGFINKLYLLTSILEKSLYSAFVSVIISSFMGLIYNYRFFYPIYFQTHKESLVTTKEEYVITTILIALVLANIVNIALLGFDFK